MISMNYYLTVHDIQWTDEDHEVASDRATFYHWLDQLQISRKKTIEIKSTAHRYTSCLPDWVLLPINLCDKEFLVRYYRHIQRVSSVDIILFIRKIVLASFTLDPIY